MEKSQGLATLQNLCLVRDSISKITWRNGWEGHPNFGLCQKDWGREWVYQMGGEEGGEKLGRL